LFSSHILADAISDKRANHIKLKAIKP